MVMRFCARQAGIEMEIADMKKFTFIQCLVLECLMLAIDLVRLANKVVALLNLTINYFRTWDQSGTQNLSLSRGSGCLSQIEKL